jgi:hypothetical protein
MKIFPTINLFRALILLGSLAIIARAQRPLNTTTNGTSVLLEPFFVKPMYADATNRGGGGSKYYSSDHEGTGIRNSEGMSPPHPNSHLDMFIPPPVNVVGGQAQQPQIPAPNNRLHKPNKNRISKFNQLRDIVRANMTKAGDYAFSQGRKVSKPEPYVHDPSVGGEDGGEHDSKAPSSAGNSLNKIKSINSKINNQHTPSPPSLSEDTDEKLEKQGIQCAFEKPCSWTFDTENITGDNFEVTTGIELKESNITGLLID